MESFHWADYLVFVTTLLISMSIGIYFAIQGRKHGTKEDFLMGSRNMPILPVSASIFVSYISSISFLADPVESYSYGFIYVLVPLGYILALPIVAVFVAPQFHKMNVISAFEYIEMRYNKTLRLFTSFVSGVATLLWMSIAVFTTSIALSQVSTLSVGASTLLTGFVATFYTTLGGMKAVIWADTIQLLIMVAGQLAILIRVTINMGGMEEIFNIARDGGRINFQDTWSEFNPLSRAAFWIYLIGGFFRILADYSSAQFMTQRFSTVRTPRDSTRAVLFNMPIYFFINGILGINGLMLYATYKDCDPLLSGRIEVRDQMVPLLVQDTMGDLPGIPGLYLATIYSSSLSSLSSGMNALSSTALTDILEPMYWQPRKRHISDKTQVAIAKVIVVFVGLSVVGFAYLLAYAGKSSFGMTAKVFGMAAGPIASLFILGLCVPWIKPKFVLVGFAVSAVLTFGVTIASFAMPPRPPMEFLAISTSGCAALNIASNVTTLPTTSTMAYMGRITTYEDSTTGADNTTWQDNGCFQWRHIGDLNPLWYAVLGLTVSTVISATLQGFQYIYIATMHRPAQSEQQGESNEKKDVQLKLMTKEVGNDECDKIHDI